MSDHARLTDERRPQQNVPPPPSPRPPLIDADAATVVIPDLQRLRRWPPSPDALRHRGDPDGRPRRRGWEGCFEPFSVGDPGLAAHVASVPDRSEWDRRDTVVDGFTLRTAGDRPLLDLRAASVRGRSHRFGGKVRQDAYAYRITDDGSYLIVAVADGVSSGPLSHVAAEIVTRQGCIELADRLAKQRPRELDWTAVLTELANQIALRGRARVEATYEGVELKTYQDLAAYLASTALFAVVTLDPSEAGLAVEILPYGDSSAWILREGRRWVTGQPVKNDHAEIATSKTKALPIPPQQALRAIGDFIRPGDALMLVSDGIGDPLGDGTGTVGAFLADAWAHPPEQLAFAAHVDFARKSHDDDRTAVVVWPANRR